MECPGCWKDKPGGPPMPESHISSFKSCILPCLWCPDPLWLQGWLQGFPRIALEQVQRSKLFHIVCKCSPLPQHSCKKPRKRIVGLQKLLFFKTPIRNSKTLLRQKALCPVKVLMPTSLCSSVFPWAPLLRVLASQAAPLLALVACLPHGYSHVSLETSCRYANMHLI